MTVYAGALRVHHSAGSVDAVGWGARAVPTLSLNGKMMGTLALCPPGLQACTSVRPHPESRVAASRRMNGTSRASWFETALRASSPWGF